MATRRRAMGPLTTATIAVPATASATAPTGGVPTPTGGELWPAGHPRGRCAEGLASPTDTRRGSLVLQQATVSVAGVTLNGASVPRGHGAGASTRFEARLVDGAGQPAAGHTVRVAYSRPNGHGSMMDGGRMILFDDGTHGDRAAGDGVYCYEDFAGDYSCHGDNSPMGQHRYDFYGMNHDGSESNHMLVTVNVTSD